jgi:hypothetical protein
MHQFPRWLRLIWGILRHPLPRYLVCWALTLYVGGRLTYEAWIAWDSDEHIAGTTGHTTVDFGGQWFTGKLLLRGEGHHLYERHHHWIVFREFWPRDPDPPTGIRSNKKQVDADNFMWWLVAIDYEAHDQEGSKTYGSCVLPLASQDPFGVAASVVAGKHDVWTKARLDKAGERWVGGQLYPPIHAFLYVPFALLSPPDAYRLATVVPAVLAFVAGWGLRKVSQGGIWWPIGTLLVFIFPHFIDAQTLGHNGALIVTLLVWGYYYLQKNADLRGGILWGLFAYKPSWAVTYFVMLLVSRRWKAAMAMGACALAQILLTLPFVGVHSWLEWRQVVATAAPGYGVYENWVATSRDLFSFPRRALTDWSAEPSQRDLFESRLIGHVLIGVALEVTVRLTSLRGRRSKRWSYAAGAFLLLGFWMCCYHITYYDTIFATLPLALLLMTPAHIFVPYFFRRAQLVWQLGRAGGGRSILALPPRSYGWVCNPLVVYGLPLILWNPWWWGQPFIVPFFAVMWLWAGWLWLREKDDVRLAPGQAAPAPWPRCPPRA